MKGYKFAMALKHAWREKVGITTEFSLKSLPDIHYSAKKILHHWKLILFVHMMLPFVSLSLLFIYADYNIFEPFCSVMAMRDSYRKY